MCPIFAQEIGPCSFETTPITTLNGASYLFVSCVMMVQNSWFPLVDRNPQTFVENIFLAQEDDFISATQRLYRSGDHLSKIEVMVLPGSGG